MRDRRRHRRNLLSIRRRRLGKAPRSSSVLLESQTPSMISPISKSEARQMGSAWWNTLPDKPGAGWQRHPWTMSLAAEKMRTTSRHADDVEDRP